MNKKIFSDEKKEMRNKKPKVPKKKTETQNF